MEISRRVSLTLGYKPERKEEVETILKALTKIHNGKMEFTMSDVTNSEGNSVVDIELPEAEKEQEAFFSLLEKEILF